MTEALNNPILKEKADFTLPNGVTVQIAPLKQDNFENLTKWIRRRYMQNIRMVLEDFPLEEQEKLLNRAVKDAALMSVKTEEGLQVLYESVYGYARLCYELIQEPPFTFDEFSKIIFPDPTNHSLYIDVLSKMFFTVYDEMFIENVSYMFGEKFMEEMGMKQDEQ